MFISTTVALFLLLCLNFSVAEVKPTLNKRESVENLLDVDLAARVNLTNRDISAESWNDLKSAFLDRGNGFFDVFYYAEKANNNIEDIREVSFDAQGNAVSKLVDLFDITQDFQKLTVSPTSAKDLHMAILAYSNDTIEFSVFTDDGSWKVIETYGELYQSFSMSGDYDAIRWCSLKRKSAKIFCKVFHLKDNSTSTSRFDAVDVDDFEIQNLPENEFLLLTSSSKMFHVIKYGADEKQRGKIEFPPLQCRDDAENGTYLYVKGNKYCAAQICGDYKEYNIINYCFNSQDFK